MMEQFSVSRQSTPHTFWQKKILLVFGLGALAMILGGGSYYWFLGRDIQKSSGGSSIQDFSVPPPENIVFAQGEIISIDVFSSSLLVKSTADQLNKRWNVKVGENTILTDFKTWNSAVAITFTDARSIEEVLASMSSMITLDDFAVGDKVYLVAAQGQDFAVLEEIENPRALLLAK